MKHIDMRLAWIKLLRDRTKVDFRRVPGITNVADFFTKLLGREDFNRWASILMAKLPEFLLAMGA